MGDVVNTHIPSGRKLNEFKIENAIPRTLDLSIQDDKIAIGFEEGNIQIYFLGNTIKILLMSN